MKFYFLTISKKILVCKLSCLILFSVSVAWLIGVNLATSLARNNSSPAEKDGLLKASGELLVSYELQNTHSELHVPQLVDTIYLHSQYNGDFLFFTSDEQRRKRTNNPTFTELFSHHQQLVAGPVAFSYLELYALPLSENPGKKLRLQARSGTLKLRASWQATDYLTISGGVFFSTFNNHGSPISSKTSIESDFASLVAKLNKLFKSNNQAETIKWLLYNQEQPQRDTSYGVKIAVAFNLQPTATSQLRFLNEYSYQRGFFSAHLLHNAVSFNYQLPTARSAVTWSLRTDLALIWELGDSWQKQESQKSNFRFQELRLRFGVVSDFNFCKASSALKVSCQVLLQTDQVLLKRQKQLYYLLRINFLAHVSI